MSSPPKFVKINKDGQFCQDDESLVEKDKSKVLFENLKVTEKFQTVTELNGSKYIVEAYDQPIVAREIKSLPGNNWSIKNSDNFEFTLNINSLCLDEWDRFIGTTESNIPFVLSSEAQNELFNFASAFDDESLTLNNCKIETESWLEPKPEIESDGFWTDIYTETPTPKWDVGQEHPSLKKTLEQLKLPKSRVLIIGCGKGHDAHFFAEQGHLVTAIDFSSSAIRSAKSSFPESKQLKFYEKNVFDLSVEEFGQFDLVFEHTLYCAINPQQRNALVTKWSQMLTEKGQLLGIFFCMNKRTGPPFGGSEWEINKRLASHNFRNLYWTRCRNSPANRLGKELVVFAEKKGF